MPATPQTKRPLGIVAGEQDIVERYAEQQATLLVPETFEGANVADSKLVDRLAVYRVKAFENAYSKHLTLAVLTKLGPKLTIKGAPEPEKTELFTAMVGKDGLTIFVTRDVGLIDKIVDGTNEVEYEDI